MKKLLGFTLSVAFTLIVFCVFSQNRTPPDFRDLDGEIHRGNEYSANKEVTLSSESFIESEASFIARTSNNENGVPENITRFLIDPFRSQEQVNNSDGVSSGIPFPVIDFYPTGDEYEAFQPYNAEIVNGQGRITIPISLPHGGASVMHPSLSIISTGSPSQGNLGVGMTISGASVITRVVGQKRYNEVEAYDPNLDFFAIDGARLVKSDNPSHVNRFFIEENENFYVEKKYDGDRPFFELHNSDGSVSIYKLFENASYDDANFYLTKREDINGNIIEYSYGGLSANAYLEKISYGRNINLKTDHYYEVEFNYMRLPLWHPYSFGKHTYRDYILESLSTSSFGRKKEEYTFKYYRRSSESKRLFLTKIDREIIEAGEFFPAIEIAWDGLEDYSSFRDYTLQTPVNPLIDNLSVLNPKNPYNIIQIDYDNDGFLELFFFPIPRGEEATQEDLEYHVFDEHNGEIIHVQSFDGEGILANEPSNFYDPNFVISDPVLWRNWMQRLDQLEKHIDWTAENNEVELYNKAVKEYKSLADYLSSKGNTLVGLSGRGSNSTNFDFNKDGRPDLVYKRLVSPGVFEVVRSTVNMDGSISVPTEQDILHPAVDLNLQCGSKKYKPNFWQFEYDLDKNGFTDLMFVHRDHFCGSNTGSNTFEITIVYDDKRKEHFWISDLDEDEDFDEKLKVFRGEREIGLKYLGLNGLREDLLMFNDLDYDGKPELKIYHHGTAAGHPLPILWAEFDNDNLSFEIERRDNITLPVGYQSTQYMDLNSDGFLDILTIDKDFKTFCLVNDGLGNFNEVPNHTLTAEIQEAVASLIINNDTIRAIYPGDFNGDGLLDMMLHFRSTTELNGPKNQEYLIQLFNENGGTFEFAPQNTRSFSSYNERFSLYIQNLDLNGDFRSDNYVQYLDQGGTNVEFHRTFRLNNEKNIFTTSYYPDNFSLPFLATRITNKNSLFEFQYNPSFIASYEIETGVGYLKPVENVERKNFYFESYNINNGEVVVRNFPQIKANLIRKFTPFSDTGLELNGQTFYRYGQTFVHKDVGNLGHTYFESYSSIFTNNDDYTFIFKRVENDVYSKNNIYNHKLLAKNMFSGYCSEIDESWELMLQLSKTTVDYTFESSHTFNYQSGRPLSVTTTTKDLETNDNSISVSTFTEGILSEETNSINGVLLSKERYEHFFQPDFWYRAFLPEKHTNTTFCFNPSGQTPCIETFQSFTTTKKYDKQGRIIETVSNTNKSSQFQRKVSIQYDTPNFRVSLKTDSIEGRKVSTFFQYDNTGLFLAKEINPVGDEASYTYDKHLGLVTHKLNANGLSTYSEYNSIGRLISSTDSRGKVSTIKKHWALDRADIGFNSCFEIVADGDGIAKEISYVDFKGNELLSVMEDIASEENIYQFKRYDRDGKLTSISMPFKSATIRPSTKSSARIDYDYRGRLINRRIFGTPLSYNIEYIYGFEALNYNPELKNRTKTTYIRHPGQASPEVQRSTSTTNAIGQVTYVSQDIGNISYQYGVLGNMETISPPSGADISFEYDEIGNQTKLIDPDFGVMNYSYNAFGELISQNDGKNTYSLKYDDLGRNELKTGNNGESFSTIYNTSGYNKGSVKSLLTHDGRDEDFKYDRWGNITEHVKAIPGEGNFKTLTEYDDFNRVIKETAPSGTIIEYQYNQEKGHLEKVVYNGTTLWEFIGSDEFGNLTQYQRNNGKILDRWDYNDAGTLTSISATDDLELTTYFNYSYSFEVGTGNLEWRFDRTKNGIGEQYREYFTYDALNRLTSVTFNLSQREPYMVLKYDDAGNIISKTGVTNSEGEYKYGDPSGYGPHAVKSIVDLDPNILPITTQNIQFNGQHQPKQISFGKGNLDKEYDLNYGFNHQRDKMSSNNSSWKEGGKDASSKLYLDSEEWWSSDGKRYFNHYVTANGILIAIVSGEVGQTPAVYYPLTDYQGSILKILDSDGNTVSERSYDPWGRLRQPFNWADYNVDELEITNRGYTGHEHLIQAGLINMNGRLYDPLIARMLSPDNYVQSEGNPQNYNRFSYVLNNPLKYTDPDGEIIVPILVGAAIGVLTNGINNSINNDRFFQGAVKAALIGGVSGAISFGIGNALTGISGIGKIAAQTFTHAHLGGVMSGINHGSYVHGFLSGAAGSLTGWGSGALLKNAGAGWQATGVIGSGMLAGGIGAKIAGGNFWDGARNGAISAGLNHAYHTVETAVLTNQLKKVYENYPTDGNNEISAQEAFSRVSPAAEKAYLDGEYSNACATRLSLAFAKAGVRLPNGYGGIKDVNGNRIIISAAQMNKFMTTKYGSLMSSYSSQTSTKGIYIGVTKPGMRYSGHVTIIRSGFNSKTYSSSMRSMSFWSVP